MSPASTRAMSIASRPERLAAGLDQRLPQRGSRRRVRDELEPELTGEPRPQDGRLHATHLHGLRVEPEVAERRQVEVRQSLHQVARRGTGGRDHRQLLGTSGDPRVQAIGRLAEPVLQIRGVDHDPVLLVRVLVHVAVVDHEPVGVDERPVAHLAGAHARQVVREPALDQPAGVRPRDLVLDRGEEVPQTRGGTDRLVLVLGRVAHGHGPWPPVLPDDVGPRRGLDIVQR